MNLLTIIIEVKHNIWKKLYFGPQKLFWESLKFSIFGYILALFLVDNINIQKTRRHEAIQDLCMRLFCDIKEFFCNFDLLLHINFAILGLSFNKFW